MDTIYDMGDGKRSRQDAQRMSDQQVTIERLKAECEKLRTENELVKDQVLTLASHAARLREALESLPYLGSYALNQYYSMFDSWWFNKRKPALADPSPAADAVRAVVEAAVRAEKAHTEYMEILGTDAELPNAQIEKVSKEMDAADKEEERAIDAYLAVTRGDVVQGNDDS